MINATTVITRMPCCYWLYWAIQSDGSVVSGRNSSVKEVVIRGVPLHFWSDTRLHHFFSRVFKLSHSY